MAPVPFVSFNISPKIKNRAVEKEAVKEKL
jgi:hypothetical protein